jgi:hypothetical protein
VSSFEPNTGRCAENAQCVLVEDAGNVLLTHPGVTQVCLKPRRVGCTLEVYQRAHARFETNSQRDMVGARHSDQVEDLLNNVQMLLVRPGASMP